MTLSDQFTQFISEKMKVLPVEEVGDVFIDGVKSDSARGVDVTGSSFVSYEPDTVRKKGNALVNLRDRSGSIESLDNAEKMSDSTGASTILRFSGNAGYGGSSKPSGEVFHYHQKGTAKGGKMRKVFPEQGDESSSNVQNKLEKVEAILAGYFNE